jgi:hypothetical protein
VILSYYTYFYGEARRGGYSRRSEQHGPSERRRDGGVSIGGLRRRSGPAFRRVSGGRRTGRSPGGGRRVPGRWCVSDVEAIWRRNSVIKS